MTAGRRCAIELGKDDISSHDGGKSHRGEAFHSRSLKGIFLLFLTFVDSVKYPTKYVRPTHPLFHLHFELVTEFPAKQKE